MIAYSISVKRDTATPVMRALQRGLLPRVINPIVGAAARDATQGHFEELNRERPNKLGGRRTNFYLKVRDKTSFKVLEDGVVVSMAERGISLRYYGGTVKPRGINPQTGKPIRFLTIPVHPRAHGKRASEFDLELVYNHNGVPVALATKSTVGVQVKQTKTGKVTKRAIGRRGEIMFLLKRSVTQQADPSILPAPDRIYGAALSNLSAHVDRLIARQEGSK